jgi:hypothetical protein
VGQITPPLVKGTLMRRFVFLTMVALVMAVVLASPAWAATFTVDRSDDPDLSTTPTADDCTDAANDCSLRGAINAANSSSGVADTINFNLVSPATITLGSQLPTITDSAGLTIDGGSANITVSGNNAVRVFEVGTSTISGAKLTLNNLTVANGRATNGGGILNNSSNTLVVNNSTISGNIAFVTVGLTGIGGGIHNNGALTVSNSTISDNNASNAGGIWNDDPSNTLTVSTVSNSTVSGNKANFGGGIYDSGTLTVSNSTISNNTGFLGTGGINGDTRFTTLKNTIVANNLGSDSHRPEDCSEIMTDGGYNLSSDKTCGFSAANNSQSGTFDPSTGEGVRLDPKLGLLAANGGPTLTHALLAGSPAIDKGVAVAGITTDQRGVTRPQGAAPDIGAFEVQSSAPDTKAPKVTNTTVPAADATRVAPGVNVTATFSEAMDAITTDGDPSTISSTTFKLMRAGTTTAIGAVVSYDAMANKATLNPNANLRLGTKYKAVVTTKAEDLAGNQLDQNSNQSGLQQKAWTFTTRN